MQTFESEVQIALN